MSFIDRVLQSFPLPAYVSMPAAGIDLSDRSVKLLEFRRTSAGMRVGRFVSADIPQGVIVNGQIVDNDKLIAILSELREKHGFSLVSASLPEEPGYIFTTTVPDVSDDEIRSLLAFKLEEHAPIAPTEAIIDFDPVDGQAPAGQRIVAVSVYPDASARSYSNLLRSAGFEPVSLEVEAQAIARAVVPASERGGCLVVDIGAARSGITVVGGGAVRFTTTVSVGGAAITDAIKVAFPDMSPQDVINFQNNEGLVHRANDNVRAAFERFAADLVKQIDRYFLYWQTHKDEHDAKLPPHRIEKVFLSGGYANIAGLPELIARNVRASVRRADVWVNAFDVSDGYIPPISKQESLGYASAIGLALHRVDQ